MNPGVAMSILPKWREAPYTGGMEPNAANVAEFYRTMSAVLSANILTGVFFYGFVSYSRREREGRKTEGGSYLTAIGLPLAFLAGGLVFTFFH